MVYEEVSFKEKKFTHNGRHMPDAGSEELIKYMLLESTLWWNSQKPTIGVGEIGYLLYLGLRLFVLMQHNITAIQVLTVIPT